MVNKNTKALKIFVSILAIITIVIAIGLPIYFVESEKSFYPDVNFVVAGSNILTSIIDPGFMWYKFNSGVSKIKRGIYNINLSYENVVSDPTNINAEIERNDFNSIKFSFDNESITNLKNRLIYYDEIKESVEIDIAETDLADINLIYLSFIEPIRAVDFLTKYYVEYCDYITFAPIDINSSEHIPAIGLHLSLGDSLFGLYGMENTDIDNPKHILMKRFGLSSTVFNTRYWKRELPPPVTPWIVSNDKYVQLAPLMVFNEILNVMSNSANKYFTDSFYSCGAFGNINLNDYKNQLERHWHYRNGTRNPHILGMVLRDVENVQYISPLFSDENIKVFKVLNRGAL